MSPRSKTSPSLDLAPFKDWYDRHHARLAAGGHPGPHSELAHRLGIDGSQLKRWLDGTETLRHDRLEEALATADLFLWDIYPELADDVDGKAESANTDQSIRNRPSPANDVPLTLSIAPIRSWLLEQYQRLGSWQRVADLVGDSRNAVMARARSTSGTAERKRVRRDVVGAWLECAAAQGCEVTLDGLYPSGSLTPSIAQIQVEEAGEEFCWPCRAFVTPIHGRCPWCEDPLFRVSLAGLSPRERAQLEETEPKWRLVEAQPKKRASGKPFRLDLDLELRRQALETYAETGELLSAGRAVCRDGNWASAESATQSVRTMLDREGWRAPASARAALVDGSWTKISPRRFTSQRRVLDERLLREAAWLYFNDDLGFGAIAKRLLHRANTNKVLSLKTALISEWNYRGWPRRTTKGAAALRNHPAPVETARCTGINEDGSRCERYAQVGKDTCVGHDPERADERIELARAASQAAYSDAVPVEPFGYWLRKQASELGSLAAVHRRVRGSISYDSLADYASMWASKPGVSARSGKQRSRVVRRSTIDRILHAWDEAVTFEDIYQPVMDDAEVEQLVAA